jgi:hypothetical protein
LANIKCKNGKINVNKILNGSPSTAAMHEIVLYCCYYHYYYHYITTTRRMRWTGHVAQMGENRNAHRILIGKPEGKKTIERSRLKCMDNFKMDLAEVVSGGLDWIGIAQDWDK